VPGLAVSYVALCAAQAASVALPGPGPSLPRRLRGTAFALIPTVVIAVVVTALIVTPGAADWLAGLAAIATPLLALASPAFVERGRVVTAMLAVVALVVALDLGSRSLTGDGARVVLIVLACTPLGALLAAATPAVALKLGIAAMTIVDTVLVIAQQIGPASRTLHAAPPPAHLPSLQDATFGSASMGWGDLFLAAVLGAVLVRTHDRRRTAVVVVFVFGSAFGLLLLRVDVLPATVPVLVGLLWCEAAARLERRGATPGSRRSRARGGSRPAR
jgi:hypothetical protein